MKKIIKLIPIIIVAFAGIFFGDSSVAFESIQKNSSSLGWLAAVAPIAFAYDGWVVSTSIAHEIKNSERNLPIALVVAPIFILIAYILYFIGISILVGPQNIVELGDAHVNVAAQKIFGDMGAKIILIFVIVSVLGTVNGYTLGFIRLPYSLAIRDMFPKIKNIANINENYGTPITSGIMAYGICIIWAVIHYLITKFGLMPNSDVSEIPIVSSYILYIILYLAVIKIYGKKDDNINAMRGLIIPILAIAGSLIIVIGGLANPMTKYYILICAVVIVFSMVFYTKHGAGAKN